MQYEAVVLPWLALEREIAVGHCRLIPFCLSDPPDLGDTKAVHGLVERLSVYHAISKKRVNSCALVVVDNEHPLRELADDEREEAWQASQVAWFAALAANEYFVHRFRPYTNSSCFRTEFLRFRVGDAHVAFGIRTIGTQHWSAWRCADVAVSQPLQCSVVHGFRFDEKLLKVLPLALSRNDLGFDLTGAMEFYNLAHADEPPLAATQQLVLMEAAVEHLFPRENFAVQVGCIALLLRTEDCAVPTKPPRRAENTWVAAQVDSREGAIPPSAPSCHYWLRELIRLRNDIIHGNRLSDRKWTWWPEEHVTMAALVIPLLVKARLQYAGLYDWTHSDKVRLGAVGRLLAVNNRWDRIVKPPYESLWARVFEKTQGDIRVREMARDLSQYMGSRGA